MNTQIEERICIIKEKIANYKGYTLSELARKIVISEVNNLNGEN